MSFLLKKQFHTTLAETLYNDILFRRSNYFYYVGRVIQWNPSDEPDTVIPDTVFVENDVRNDIVGIKRITAGDLSLVTRRIDWTSGVVYDMYDSTIDLSNRDFFVLTDDFNVYKCLDNNLNTPSTVKPTGNDFDPITTSDGYIWKYMYTIPVSLRNKFLTSENMPVQRALTSNFYSYGAIQNVIVEDQGDGYSGEPVTQINVTGDGVDAYLVPVVAQDSGSIVDVKIVNGGTGYTQAFLSVTDPFNTGSGKYGNADAVLTPILDGGTIIDVIIEDPGQNYSDDIQTTLELQGDGSGARITPFILDGKLTDVIIEEAGVGYTYATVDVVGVTGSGASVRVELSKGDLVSDQSTIEQTAIQGAIHAVKVSNGGTGYTFINFEIYGDGTGLTIEPIFLGGELVKINVLDPGYGYSYCNITVTGDGTGATVVPIIAPGRGHGSDAVTELLADSLILYSTINQDRFHNVLMDNDIRTFGLLKNPTESYSTSVIRKDIATSCYLVNFINQTGLANDDVLSTGDGRKTIKIVQIANNGVLVLPINNIALDNFETFFREGDNESYQINEILLAPEFNKFSGDLLYISHNPGIDYSAEQLITLKSVIIL